ncbi:MAG: ABC transporter permease [Bacillota bacterium]
MAYYLDLVWAYAAQYLKGRAAYSGDFLAALFSEILSQLSSVVFVLVVFTQIPDLQGWNRSEMIFLYGYFLVPFALFQGVAANLWNFGDRFIIKGELDRILTRPVNPMLQLVLEGFELESLLGGVTGLVVMALAGHALGIHWGWAQVLGFLAFTVSGALVYVGLYVTLATVAFWTDSRTGLMPLMWNFNTYARYPVSIYNRILRLVLTWVLPFAFAGSIPAAALLGREGTLRLALWTPPVGLGSLLLASAAWTAGLRRYHGAGS